MYAPKFFTGRLITRFGARSVVMISLALSAVAATVGLLGVDVAHFWLPFVLLGVGWNFGFVVASAPCARVPSSGGKSPRAVTQ